MLVLIVALVVMFAVAVAVSERRSSRGPRGFSDSSTGHYGWWGAGEGSGSDCGGGGGFFGGGDGGGGGGGDGGGC